MKKNRKSSLTARSLRLESLENRAMLSVNPIVAGATDDVSAAIATADVADQTIDLSNAVADSESTLVFTPQDVASKFTLSWNAVDDASSYIVRVSKDGGNTWIKKTQTTDTSVGISEIKVGSAFYYRVFSVSEDGTTQADYQSGAIAPLSLSASSPDYKAGSSIDVALKVDDASQVDVKWYQVTDDGDVEIEEAAGLLSYAPTSNAYSVKVVATGLGGVSDSTVLSPYGSHFTVTSYSSSSRTVDAQWDAIDGASSYTVRVSKDGGNTWSVKTSTTDLSMTATGIKEGQTYLYRVYGRDANGVQLSDYYSGTISPFTISASREGDAASVSIAGSDVNVRWYQVTDSGDVEIEDAAGLLEYSLDSVDGDVKVVATSVGDATGFFSKSVVLSNYGSHFTLSSYDSSTRVAEAQWDAIDGASSYFIKVSKDGGQKWSFKTSSTTDLAMTATGVYSSQSYLYRLYARDASGAVLPTYYEGEISPSVTITADRSYYVTDDTVSVSVSGSDNVDIKWYKITDDGDVEIEDAAGLTQYTFDNEDYDVRVVATSAGDATGYFSDSVVVYHTAVPETPSVVVNSLEDVVDDRDGIITLREAVEVYAADGDTVTFDASLAGGTITLDGSQIEIKKDLTIDARSLYDYDASKPGITIDCQLKSRAFYSEGVPGLYLKKALEDDGTRAYAGTEGGHLQVEIAGLEIINGTGSADGTNYGGAIYAKYTNLTCDLLDVHHCFSNDATWLADNGTWYNDDGTLVTATDNSSTMKKGLGGAIYVHNYVSSSAAYTLTGDASTNYAVIKNSKFYGCSGSRGAALYFHSVYATVQNCDVSDNYGPVGGAVMAMQGPITVDSSTFDNNISYGTSTFFGGAVINLFSNMNNFRYYADATITNSTFTNNLAHESNGGAISTNACNTVTIDNCLFKDNTSLKNGGAVSIEGSYLTMTNSVVIGNKTTTTGDGDTGIGGGIAVYPGKITYDRKNIDIAPTMTLQNVVIAQNTGKGGGVAVSGLSEAGLIENCTIADNVATLYASGIYNYNSALTINNSIIVGDGVAVYNSSGTVNGNYVLSSYELWSNASETTYYVYDSSDTLFKDAQNGDYALAEGSVAIDKGSNDLVTTDSDITGATRIQGSAVDLGAYEYAASASADDASEAALDEFFADYFDEIL